MNIIFLTIYRVSDINDRGIYTDLMRKFRDEGHQIYIVCPVERKFNIPTFFVEQNGIKLLTVKTFNIQKTNVIEKGIGILAIEYQFLYAINKYLSDIKFDLVLYSTPPITFTKVIRKIKNKYAARSYLMLKDIFPQNAIDIKMMKDKGLLHIFFRRKEKILYEVSDYIGCLSPANVTFLLKNNPSLQPIKVELCPNSIEVSDEFALIYNKENFRHTFDIPSNATVFIYGGNLGKPQGIDFLLKVLNNNKHKPDRFFIVTGSGTEFNKIKNWFNTYKPSNAKLLSMLPKVEYDKMIQCCDVGLIFLDPRFTIPNYPSRLLSYMEHKMPVLMAIDINTDIGRIAEINGYGLWSINGHLGTFDQLIEKLCNNPKLIKQMGEKGYQYLRFNYTVDKTYNIIMNHFI